MLASFYFVQRNIQTFNYVFMRLSLRPDALTSLCVIVMNGNGIICAVLGSGSRGDPRFPDGVVSARGNVTEH
jgi:hypothetical protein